jgi:hypothetical protein
MLFGKVNIIYQLNIFINTLNPILLHLLCLFRKHCEGHSFYFELHSPDDLDEVEIEKKLRAIGGAFPISVYEFPSGNVAIEGSFSSQEENISHGANISQSNIKQENSNMISKGESTTENPSKMEMHKKDVEVNNISESTTITKNEEKNTAATNVLDSKAEIKKSSTANVNSVERTVIESTDASNRTESSNNEATDTTVEKKNTNEIIKEAHISSSSLTNDSSVPPSKETSIADTVTKVDTQAEIKKKEQNDLTSHANSGASADTINTEALDVNEVIPHHHEPAGIRPLPVLHAPSHNKAAVTSTQQTSIDMDKGSSEKIISDITGQSTTVASPAVEPRPAIIVAPGEGDRDVIVSGA